MAIKGKKVTTTIISTKPVVKKLLIILTKSLTEYKEESDNK